MKKAWVIITILFFSFLLFSCSDFEGGTSKSMQQDFDKIRLDHILIISGLVNEYKEKVGYFPFANRSEKPIVVTIASEKQIEEDNGNSPIFIDLNSRATDGHVPEQPKSIEKVTLQEFNEELEKGLQRKVTIPINPQKVPVNKSCLYIYTYYLGVFDVTTFLHNEFAFTRPLGQFNNKITVGSRSYPYSAIWTPEDLMKQEEFRKFFQSSFNSDGYTIKTVLK